MLRKLLHRSCCCCFVVPYRGQNGNCRRLSQMIPIVCVLLAGAVLFQMFLVNVFLIYVFKVSKDTFQQLTSTEGSFLSRLSSVEFSKELLAKGKNGGLSVFMQDTIDRLFVMKVPKAFDDIYNDKQTDNRNELYVFGIDVSNSGEALYVYRRILQRQKFPYAKLVVDIGANDGLLSSNSYNFIQWGWNAILVEPLKTQLDLARQNTARLRSLYGRRKQNVTFVNALIGSKNGLENFVVSVDVAKMEGHVLLNQEEIYNQENVIQVPSMTVRTLATRYKVPKYFAVLSVDAEGVGDLILHRFIEPGFRPAYIIYEAMHNGEPVEITHEFLTNNNYKFLIKMGWNYVYEHQKDVHTS